MECLHYPIAAVECLFGDLDNLLAEEETEFAEVRLYQIPFLSYEYLIDEIPTLTKKENFKLRENVGSIECFSARRIGKTLICEIVDILLSCIHQDGEEVGFTSLDMIHIRSVLEKVIDVITRHSFFKIFKVKVNRSPNYKLSSETGWSLISINMNVQSRNPGNAFFGKHLKKLYIEEASMETEEVYNKRIEAVAENGCVVRAAGMLNLTKYSPAGRRIFDLKNQKRVCNLPLYVSPSWNEKEKQKSIKEYGGESSISYRIYVKAEIVEDGVSVMDMHRVRSHYIENKLIKHFEIKKENFVNFSDIIIVDRPNGVDSVWIAADIGETAPTEIAIFFKIEKTYTYAYSITCYNLTDRQQLQLFDFLIKRLNAEMTALDTSDGQGRAIYRGLNETYKKENLCWCGFSEKISVGFERDENERLVIDGKTGNPIEKEEFVSEWSVKILKDMLYDGLIKLPLDYRLDKQLNSIRAIQTANRISYEVIGGDDHLFAAFRVFGIAHWLNIFKNLKPNVSKVFAKSGV